MLNKIGIIAIILILLSAGTVSAGLYEPTVILSDFEVVPSVLMPGDTGMITVTLKNTATSTTSTTTDSVVTTKAEINPTITSVFLDGGKKIKVLGGNSEFSGDLGPQQSVSLSFAVLAPEEEGIYYAVLRVSVKGSENLIYPIPVNVNMPISALKKPVLILTQSGDDTLIPGGDCEVALSIYNSGKSTAEDIFFRISEDDPSIAPLSSATYHVSDLSSGETAYYNVSFISDQDMEPGIHEIPLLISYNIVDGTSLTQTEAIALNFKGAGETSIASLKTDPVRVIENDRFDLTIRIENTGTGDAKSTVAVIDLPFTGNKEAYVGKIKPGNDAPAIFTLDAGDSGNYNYTLKVSYEDDTGAHESVHPLSIAIRKNEDGSGIIFGIILLILAAGGGYYYFVYRKNEEEKV
ncbi:MAG: hypothetical protein JXQ82_06030 [Methanomicrobiaceae archaeon]|nr:hypothetical protein [Methanomicrobiaceae archaeon]